MTPEQRKCVDDCKSRIRYARQGGIADEIVCANLKAEGWPAAAVEQAVKELGERNE